MTVLPGDLLPGCFHLRLSTDVLFSGHAKENLFFIFFKLDYAFIYR